MRLNPNQSLRDFEEKDVPMVAGLPVLLNDHDGLSCNGFLEYNEDENVWVAVIDWSRLTEA